MTYRVNGYLNPSGYNQQWRAVGGGGLFSEMVLYFPLDDTGSPWTDTVGSLQITGVNSPGVRSGTRTWATFNSSSSQSLSCTSFIPLNVVDDHRTINICYRPTTPDQAMGLYQVGSQVAPDTSCFWGIGDDVTTAGQGWRPRAYNGDLNSSYATQGFDNTEWYNLWHSYGTQQNFGGPGTTSISWSTEDIDETRDTFVLGSGPEGYWNGDIAWIAVYDAEINGHTQGLMQMGPWTTYSELPAARKVNLVEWWDLSEASGTRYASIGGNDLTDNNSVGSASRAIPQGGLSRCINFNIGVNAPRPYATGSSDSAWHFHKTNGSTLALWVDPCSFYSTGTPIHKGDGSIDEWAISTSGVIINEPEIKVDFYLIGGVGDWADYSQATPANGIIAGRWNLLTIWWDPSDKKAYFQINNGTPASGSALTTTPYNGSDGVSLNRWPASSGDYMGMMQGIMKWDRVLTADERTALWNDGNGLFP
jgi:hypothetical protein